MDAISKYRIRRSKRLDARGYRKDDEEETNAGNNAGNHGGGGHGNTRLPYGLCHKYGIEIGKAWQPRDAWEALKGKGVTPGGEFSKMGGKSTTIRHGTATYSNVKTGKAAGRYTITGDMEQFGKKSTGAMFAHFGNKKEMFACLQEYGVDSATDPDTGETVNPMKMDLPKTVAKKGEHRYTDLVLGMRSSKSGRPFDDKGYTIVGKDFDGKKTVLGVFSTPEKAKEFAQKTMKCKPEDLRETKEYRSLTKKGA